MYGSIFNMDVKEGHEGELLGLMDALEAPAGMLGWFVMKPDLDDRKLIGVAVFRDKEAYVANANRPEQHESFMKIMDHLASEPDWTDGEYGIGEVI